MIGWFLRTWELDGGAIEEAETACTIDNSAYKSPASRKTLDDIPIEGNSEFVNYVKNCLFHVSQHGQFAGVVSQLKKIKQVGFYADTGMNWNGVFDVELPTLRAGGLDDHLWGASQIIHDATHYQRMLNGTFDSSNPVEEELIAFVPQAAFLRDCGSHSNAAFVEGLDGRHCLR